MAEIIAYNMRGKETLSIYDPTSGSGSLLINIGQAVSGFLGDKNKIKYYAQAWEPMEDQRFSGYGLAPKSKADYAFLLHNLYHLNSGGIMTIVLPMEFCLEEERKGLLGNSSSEGIILKQSLGCLLCIYLYEEYL